MLNSVKRRMVVVGILLAALSLAGCGDKKGPAGPPPGPPEVGVITIEPQAITLTDELPGRISPKLIAEVRPQVGGIIKRRLFTEGGEVKAGQSLYQIDPSTYEAAHASAKALQSRAEASLASARLKAERYSDLIKIHAVSQQDFDDAQAALQQAEADLAVSKAAVENARINLAYTTIKAPISGRIGRSTVTEGALVTANQNAELATIQQLDTVYVDITQSSAELLKIKDHLAGGQLKRVADADAKVTLVLENGVHYPVAGTLKFSEVTVSPSTGSVTLRAIFPNPEQTLLPGMFVRALLIEGVEEHAILVPQRGVSRNPGGEAMVMVVGAEEKVEAHMIKIVRAIGDNWLVSDGVKAGDRVILDGLQRIRPGAQVKAVPFGAPPAAAPTAAPAEKKS